VNFTDQQAYAALKQLENEGALYMTAQPTATVGIGTWTIGPKDSFSWSVPTIRSNDPFPPITVAEGAPDQGPADGQGPIQKPHPIPQPPPPPLDPRAGLVFENADSLTLKFEVAAAPGQPISPVTALWNEDAVNATTKSTGPGKAEVLVTLGNTNAGSWEAGILTVRFRKSAISLQEFAIRLQVGIARLPDMSAGALTIPVVPVGVAYTPPPGPQNKNYATYKNTVTLSHKIDTKVSRGTKTTQATAYTQTEFISKIASLAEDVIKVVQAIGSAGAAGASGAAGAASAGGADKGKGGGIGDIALPVISLVTDVLTGFVGDPTSSSSSQLEVSSEHSVTYTATETDTFTAGPAAQGAGDKFLYLRNVRIAWFISGFELDFTVLGNDGLRAFPGEDLLADQNELQAGGAMAGSRTNLDLASVKFLLGLDPFVTVSDPALGPPRFTQVGEKAGDAVPQPDTFQVSHGITTEDTTAQNSITTDISDYKPGWLDALFGGNTATDSQVTLTYATSDQVTVGQTQTIELSVSGPYGCEFWLDNLFGTFAFTALPPTARRPIN
jgi:hypothetical protein